jgi:predicted Zn-ribbon and HTH transcriptional regulator
MVDCRFCGYAWQPRVASPKACPRCKNRLDYNRQQTVVIDIRQVLEDAGNE